MLLARPTPEMISEWKTIWTQYHKKLTPNRKSGSELAKYLSSNYLLEEIDNPEVLAIVTDNVLSNEPFFEKLPPGTSPAPIAFYINKEGNGSLLYQKQDTVFKGTKILVGIDLVSGCYFVEGSSLLWDELIAYQGLDEIDINNYFLVAQYITALITFDKLNKVIRKES